MPAAGNHFLKKPLDRGRVREPGQQVEHVCRLARRLITRVPVLARPVGDHSTGEIVCRGGQPRLLRCGAIGPSTHQVVEIGQRCPQAAFAQDREAAVIRPQHQRRAPVGALE